MEVPSGNAVCQVITESSQLRDEEGTLGNDPTNQVVTEISELARSAASSPGDHQLITDSSELEGEGLLQTITESSERDDELSPSDSNECVQLQPSASNHLYVGKHQCPWHCWLWSFMVVLFVVILYCVLGLITQ
jgi:hypothetical protein